MPVQLPPPVFCHSLPRITIGRTLILPVRLGGLVNPKAQPGDQYRYYASISLTGRMAKASFYILTSGSPQERYFYACKVIEKAYRSGHFCYVLTDSIKQSQYLDDLLWTFREGSFIPHQLYTGEIPDFKKVILIGSLDAPEHWKKTIINLSSQCPKYFESAERIFEILDNSEEIKEPGRNRFLQYQQSGIATTIHKIAHTA